MSKKKVTAKIPTPSSAISAGKTGSGSPMDVGLLEQIIKLMGQNDLNTVDLRDGEKRVILKRGAAAPIFTHTAPSAGFAASASSSPGNQSAPPATPASSAPDEDKTLVAIKSPMVGTFYAAPSPDSKPFVSIGSAIDEETEVCTIEAMKNYVPIKAETRGTITKILVNNGQTVQFGQVLFMVKP